MAACLILVCSCTSNPPEVEDHRTSMQIAPAVEKAEAENRARFSLVFGIEGAIGAQGIDGRAGFAMEYDSGSWAIGVESPIPIEYPGSR